MLRWIKETQDVHEPHLGLAAGSKSRYREAVQEQIQGGSAREWDASKDGPRAAMEIKDIIRTKNTIPPKQRV